MPKTRLGYPTWARLTWCLIQLLQHGEQTVVKKQLQRPCCLCQEPSDGATQLPAHQAVGIIWGDRPPCECYDQKPLPALSPLLCSPRMVSGGRGPCTKTGILPIPMRSSFHGHDGLRTAQITHINQGSGGHWGLPSLCNVHTHSPLRIFLNLSELEGVGRTNREYAGSVWVH